MKRWMMLIVLIPVSLVGQRLWLHGGAGIANYSGDIQQKWVTPDGARPAFSVGASYTFFDHFALRADLSYATIGAADRNNTDPSLVQRNLSFRTAITEAALMAEYHVLSLERNFISPYVFAGVGVFRFNPYTYDSAGSKIFLQPLSTEGQGIPGYEREHYRRTRFSVPYGAGIRWAATPNFHVAAEIGLRKLFTDYLDDVSTTYADRNELLAHRGSQSVRYAFRGSEINHSLDYPAAGTIRGNPANNDAYYFLQVRLLFRINAGGVDDEKKFFRRQVRCPG